MNGKRLVTSVVAAALLLIGSGHALAQDPTPLPDRAVEEGAGFELVGEYEFDGEAITQVAAAPDGSLICAVTDDRLLTCTDRDGGGFTRPEPNRIIAVLIGLNHEVFTIQQGVDAPTPLLTKISATGDEVGSMPLEGFVDANSDGAGHFLGRLDPRTNTIIVARAGGHQVFTIDVSQFSANDSDVRPTEEIEFFFPVRDVAVAADGSLIALSEDGQVFRASPGGTFEALPVDYNSDGIVSIIGGAGNDLLIGGQGTDWMFVVGQRNDPVSGDSVMVLHRVDPDGLTPVASWVIVEGEHVSSGLVLADGSVMIDAGADNIYRVDPDGAIQMIDWGSHKPGGGATGQIVMFNDPTLVNPSFVRYEKASPKLQEFMLRGR